MASRVVSIAFMQNEKPRMTCTKYLERTIVRAWKSVSRASRKAHRASILPEDFVMLTNRRRSIFYSSA
ncbi:hypothetical protein QCA50_010471 [Cerrena zonata]|uniref:Uncharacterized protein n=1 Tax=Cerrena zonata TaxID=2478898 RepID=A0AAW0G9F2_9APHY